MGGFHGLVANLLAGYSTSGNVLQNAEDGRHGIELLDGVRNSSTHGAELSGFSPTGDVKDPPTLNNNDVPRRAPARG